MGKQLDHGFHARMIDRRTAIGAALAGAASLQTASALASEGAGQVVELRQYTLRKGQRDLLIGLFERHFIEPQNALGAHVLGTFRDLDDPDRFVWLRGFDDMPQRREALTAFYGGPVWQAHRNAANATMLDSDNVLLLRLRKGLAGGRSGGAVRIAIHYLGNADSEAFLAFFDQTMRPMYEQAGARVEAVFVTAAEPNNFPRLPVREGERVLVWATRFRTLAGEARFEAAVRNASGWRDSAPAALLPALMRKPEVLRLAPTARSAWS
jgi:hypothetical protein